MIEFRDLLEKEHIDPAGVILARHRPNAKELRQALPWMVTEREELFETFQSSHRKPLETALTRATYLASFIGLDPAEAVWVGLYRVSGWKPLSRTQYEESDLYRELREYGHLRAAEIDERDDTLLFNLEKMTFYEDWKGRLIIEWPGLERSWWRRAHKKSYPVKCITRDSQFALPMPDWRSLRLSWMALKRLPKAWEAQLLQWRGIYLISDNASGKKYVGSAGGASNLFGRWQNYASTGHGGNALLKRINPENLEFSILERVSPDAPLDELISLENSWKIRLNTMAPAGLNAN